MCQESPLDTEYSLTLSEEGRIWYLGKYSSSIQFNKTQQVWQWFDKKDNTGYAIRNELFIKYYEIFRNIQKYFPVLVCRMLDSSI